VTEDQIPEFEPRYHRSTRQAEKSMADFKNCFLPSLSDVRPPNPTSIAAEESISLPKIAHFPLLEKDLSLLDKQLNSKNERPPAYLASFQTEFNHTLGVDHLGQFGIILNNNIEPIYQSDPRFNFKSFDKVPKVALPKVKTQVNPALPNYGCSAAFVGHSFYYTSTDSNLNRVELSAFTANANAALDNCTISALGSKKYYTMVIGNCSHFIVPSSEHYLLYFTINNKVGRFRIDQKRSLPHLTHKPFNNSPFNITAIAEGYGINAVAATNNDHSKVKLAVYEEKSFLRLAETEVCASSRFVINFGHIFECKGLRFVGLSSVGHNYMFFQLHNYRLIHVEIGNETNFSLSEVVSIFSSKFMIKEKMQKRIQELVTEYDASTLKRKLQEEKLSDVGIHY
jgi:hypothetical protein